MRIPNKPPLLNQKIASDRMIKMKNGKIVFENGNLVGCEESKEIEKASKCLSNIIYNSDIYKKYSNVLHDKHKR
jgi:hypothetical protein